ncbi:MAG: hypothetical protein P8X92_08355 [Dehalococcoidia bacterium]
MARYLLKKLKKTRKMALQTMVATEAAILPARVLSRRASSLDLVVGASFVVGSGGCLASDLA